MEGNGGGGKPLVRTSDDLRAHFGQLSPLAEKKVLHHLDKFCRDFIALSPFLVLASSDGKGNADASPRGFEGTRLKMEGDSRFDGFPLMPDIEVIDMIGPALPWRGAALLG